MTRRVEVHIAWQTQYLGHVEVEFPSQAQCRAHGRRSTSRWSSGLLVEGAVFREATGRCR